MARFRDIRKSVVKRTAMDHDNRKFTEVATVQRISPYDKPGSLTVREGIKAEDIIFPTYNRVKRRADGQVKSRNRLRGSIPPHPLKVINQAHRMQRNCNHILHGSYVDNGIQYCNNCHVEQGIPA